MQEICEPECISFAPKKLEEMEYEKSERYGNEAINDQIDSIEDLSSRKEGTDEILQGQ